MKHFITSILAILYFATSTGMTVHMHYCMDKLISVSLVEEGDDHTCGHCGMKKKNNDGCCKDEHKVVKSETKAAIVKDIIIKADHPVSLPTSLSYYAYKVPATATYGQYSVPAHAPPPFIPSCPIYIAVRNFRV